MIRFSYIIILLVLEVIMFQLFFYVARKKDDTARAFKRLITVAGFLIIFNICALVEDFPDDLAVFFQGCYYGCYSFLMIFFLEVINIFTNGSRLHKQIRIPLIALACADAASLVLNAFLHHAFTPFHTVIKMTGEPVRSYLTGTPFYQVHLYFCYCLAAATLLLLVFKLYRTYGLYHRKYLAITMVFVVILFLDAGYVYLHQPLNMSLIFYLGGVITVYYYLTRYIPKILNSEILTIAIHNMESGVVCFDLDKEPTFVSKYMYKLLGIEDEDPSKVARHFMLDENKPTLQKGMLDWYQTDLDHISPFQREDWDSGATTHYEVRYNIIRDSHDRLIGTYYMIYDRSNEVAKMNQEHFRATHDPLTGQYNREGFMEKVRALLDHAGEKQYVMLYSNIKDFKLVNDLFGTPKGDEILRHIASALEKHCSGDEVFGRVGPDQFALCMPAERFYKEMFTEYIKEACELVDSIYFNLHIHVGIYYIEHSTDDISLICDKASMAIATIKNNNELIFAEYTDKIMDQVLQERRIISEFDRTIGTESFRFYLQPQMDRDKKLRGAEALVRWIHPIKGDMSQEDFLPILENNGLLWRLDLYIWEEAIKQIKRWENTVFSNLSVSVNISPKDFYYLDVYKAFVGLVERYRIDPGRLNLEITESAFMSEPSNQIGIVKKLRQYGFSVEMDDFGSGYSSLNMLKDMEVDVLKIDMGFLRGSEDPERTRMIILSIIEMAHKLRIPVLAEGVETAEQLEFLTKAGCDLFQGYYFGKPISVERFEERFGAEIQDW